MLAVLVAILAIPLLALDTPDVAGGLETTSAPIGTDESASVSDAAATALDELAGPDIALLAARAGTWTEARGETAPDIPEEGVPEEAERATAVEVNLSALLANGFAPFEIVEVDEERDASEVDVLEEEDAEAVVDADIEEEAVDEEPILEELLTTEPVEEEPVDDLVVEAEQASEEVVPEEAPVEEQPTEDTDVEDADVEDAEVEEEAVEEPAEEEPAEQDSENEDSENEDAEGEAESTDVDVPTPPAQVDGRVPPPAGGPTAAQWDAVRNCESTHNYQAINPSGKFRGAYQFSIQTWDWVAGIHWPHLVGVDPAAADPAWQDVMAYTLFAMRGWDQWPECGRHLL